ncbi:MAG: hypothetical protein KJ063_23910 [Anaerolineae bacterium]|nr:hypothetical protein [Anaerolineae bacterium]
MSPRYTRLGMLLWFLLATIAILYFRATPSRQLTILARDWEIIDLSPPGQKFYHLSSQWFSFLAPPVNYKPNELVIENVNFTVIDVTDLEVEIIFDPATFLYQLTILDRARDIMVTYALPFEVIPPELEEAVVFRSNTTDALNLVSKQRVELLSNRQTTLTYMYDKPCELRSRLGYDFISRSRNRLVVGTLCNKTSDQFIGTIYDDISPFILLSSFSAIVFQDIVNLAEEETVYLIVVEPEQETYISSFTDSIFIESHPQIRTSEEQGSLMIRSNDFDTLTLHGITGKVSAGIRTESTDELSELSIQFDNNAIPAPSIEWNNRLLINEDGSTRIQPILSVTGIAQKVRLNGVEIIPSRWSELTPDLQAAIFTLFLTAFGSLILFAVRDHREEPVAPIIHNQIHLPDNNTNQNNFFKIIIGTLSVFVLVIAWLIHKLRKTWWE